VVVAAAGVKAAATAAVVVVPAAVAVAAVVVNVVADRMAQRSAAVDSVDDRVRSTTLDNGVRVISDPDPSSVSTSLSVWVAAGSRDDPSHAVGAAHFLEHMMFKGTTARTSHDINVAIEATGGELNAFTSREHTAYLTRVPADDTELAARLLVELVAQPRFHPEDLEVERDVILEELAMVGDTPDDLAATLLAEAVFAGHPLGWETLGRTDTLEAMDMESLRLIHSANYGGTSVIVAAAGAVDHDLLCRVSSGLGDGGAELSRTVPTDALDMVTVEHRDNEQVQLNLGWRGVPSRHPDRFAVAILLQILGDGPSSRLYRKIRDERGLAYSVFSSQARFSDSGMVSISLGTGPDDLGACREIIATEIADLKANGPTDEELAVAIGSMSGAVVLSLEDSGQRMARLGMSALLDGLRPPSDSLRGYAAVGSDDVRRVALDVFGSPCATVAVGPISIQDVTG